MESDVGLIVRDITMAELFGADNINELIDEYADESKVEGLPKQNAKISMYEAMEKANAIKSIGAFFDDKLIGFILLIAPIMPHYDARLAVTESFFVSKEYRKTGAGLKLINAAKEYTKNQNACGLMLTAPEGSDLAKVLPKVGCKESNRVFFWRTPQ